MIKDFARISVPTLAAIAMVYLGGSAKANFQYVPGNDGTGSSSTSDNESAAATNTAPIARQTLPAAPALPPAPPHKQPKSGGAIITGFGRQVPLVIALREIVPASYQFAFADGINLGTLVDWQGGKPWRDVMNDVVTPLGLTAVEKNMVIYVDRQH